MGSFGDSSLTADVDATFATWLLTGLNKEGYFLLHAKDVSRSSIKDGKSTLVGLLMVHDLLASQ
jgi:hypothetical protein